jgi:predicted  nucleic acid-binding Zn-ribbon protein
VKAFSSGNNEENILHWAAILRLFDQKGLKLDVEVLAKAAKDLMGVLETIQKLLGKKKTTSDADQLELEETKQLVSDAKAEFLKAMQKPFDLVRQLNRRGENPMGQSCFGDV